MTITLATLAQATEQEIFDQVARHLVKQGVRAYSGGSCKYRSADGLMCAVGCLMSDEEYDEKYDLTGGWYGVTEKYSSEVPSAHLEFLADLQQLHDALHGNYGGDNHTSIEINYLDRLKYFVQSRNLTIPQELLV